MTSTGTGLELHADVSGDGYPLVLLHGFTGSAEAWTAFAGAWPGLRLVTVDLPGHGRSPACPPPERYAMEDCVRDLHRLLDRLGITKAHLLGYSMGGRVALRAALAAPDRYSALVLESASPGIEDPDERAARVAADEALAASIEQDGIEAFVDRWQALPLFTSHAALPEDARARLRALRLRCSSEGLASSLRAMGAGRDTPVVGRLGALRMPVLLLTGELDEKYRMLAAKMERELPDGRHETVEGAGHTIHLERAEEYARLVGDFLACHTPLPARGRHAG